MTQGVHDIRTGENIDAQPMTAAELAEHESRTKPAIDSLKEFVDSQAKQ